MVEEHRRITRQDVEGDPVIRAVVRRNTIFLSASMALLFAGMQHVPSLGGLVAERITGSTAAAGIPMAAMIIGLSLAAYPAGRLMDRVGRVPVLIAGYLAAIVGAVAVAVSVGVGFFVGVVLGAALIGVGTGIGLLGRLCVAEMYPPERRGQAVGYAIMGITVGAIGGPLLTAQVAALVEARGGDPLMLPWVIAAFLFAAAAAVVALVRPDPRQIAAAFAVPGASDQTIPGTTPDPRRSILLATGSTAAVQAAMVVMMSIMPLAIVRSGGTLGMVSVMMALHFFGMYGLAIPVGWLGDTVGYRRVLAAGAVVTGGGSALAGIATAFPLIVAGLFLVGIGWSGSYLAGTALVSTAASPQARGRALGRYDLIAWAAAAAAIIGAGPLLATYGLVVVATIFVAVALGGVGFAWFQGEWGKKKNEA